MDRGELVVGAVLESVVPTVAAQVVGRIGDIPIFGDECWVGVGDWMVVREVGDSWVMAFGTDRVLYQIDVTDWKLCDREGGQSCWWENC